MDNHRDEAERFAKNLASDVPEPDAGYRGTIHGLLAIHDLLDERLPKGAPEPSRPVDDEVPRSQCDEGHRWDSRLYEGWETCFRCGLRRRKGEPPSGGQQGEPIESPPRERIGWLRWPDGPVRLVRETEDGYGYGEDGWTHFRVDTAADFEPILDPATEVVVRRDDLATLLSITPGWTGGPVGRLRAALGLREKWTVRSER